MLRCPGTRQESAGTKGRGGIQTGSKTESFGEVYECKDFERFVLKFYAEFPNLVVEFSNTGSPPSYPTGTRSRYLLPTHPIVEARRCARLQKIFGGETNNACRFFSPERGGIESFVSDFFSRPASKQPREQRRERANTQNHSFSKGNQQTWYLPHP